ncbi:penicillin acylase family protein [Thermomonas hydrothermalis]|uniref:Penicillin amidase n=1 Tax=Thermomonas hydrothermalis TaxID=213588 RepID=A0A1M4UUA9_9GAMM|nr:penicillin acylase family protein [Thermomonas hydrothermalis]MCL6620150.1 penicillin acylase family protein [Thermomonas hydrothermalis]SHE60259.1 penicillin amidase [Thermomonas hydrothermalis]
MPILRTPVWARRLTLALLLLLLTLGISMWWLLRGSLPTLDGQMTLPGLTAPVTVTRDALGTVTIEAQSQADALRALGYVHAQERYFEMDLMRRSAAGELAALVGPKALTLDQQHRLHRLRARVSHALPSIASGQRAQLDAYVAGVNAGLQALRVRPWPYLLLRQTPAPWRVEDTPLVAMAMYFDLQGGTDPDALALWRMRPYLPPALYALLTHDGSRWDAPLQGAPRGDARLPTATQVDLRTLPFVPSEAAPHTNHDTPGSNNFAVAGALTADGRAIVANDMHLTLRVPNIWFRARLRYPDPAAPGGKVEVQGVTLPGLPLVVVGSNGRIAWGFTNSYIDTMDWKREQPCGRYASPGCVPLVRHVERIDVAGGKPITLTVEQSDWGPVLQRQPDGSVLTLRWAAHLPGALNLELSRFAQAPDLDAALRIADTVAMPTQNMVIADQHGQIAWRLLGPIPQRAPTCTLATSVEDPRHEDCPPWPLSSGGALVLRSPQHARLWTANARVLDGPDLARVGDGGYALGIRAAQIRDDLQRRNRFREHDLLAIQLDDRAVLLTPWQQLLLERARVAGTPALTALAAAAHPWQGRAEPTSVSYRIVRAWRQAVQQRIAEGLTAPARAALGDAFVMPTLPQLEGIAWPLVSQRPAHLLPRKFSSWDALFEDAAMEVRHTLQQQGPLTQRSWGEQNTAAICHPLAAAIPWLGKRWLCIPAQPLAGDGLVPRVARPNFGASERMVVAPGHEADGLFHMPGGQSSHPLSPFWGAGHADWVQGRPTPFLPGPARHTLVLQPAMP